MKVVGLITEYNPFHNGHNYHIQEAKRVTGADYVIAVMSGNFVQRGIPAVIDKYSRAEMALQNGVDLVLEIPACYATGSAEFFAHGAVCLLDKLGIVDTICFGSECGDITLLQKTAHFLLHTPDSFDNSLQAFLKDGLTYPAARLKALEYSLKNIEGTEGTDLTKVLTEPNNILGIEYMKALQRLSSPMIPITIQRISAHYHDKNLAASNITSSDLAINNLPITSGLNAEFMNDLEFSDQVISSATAIRNAIDTQNNPMIDHLTEIEHSVPCDVYRFLLENYQKTYPITVEDFAQIIKYKLSAENSQSLSEYLDITSDLADRIKNLTDFNVSISTLTQTIKSKNMTLTRINRALIHLLLNIKTSSLEEYTTNGYVPYARVLGIKKESSHLLRNIEKVGRIPIVTKISKAYTQLDTLGMRMLSEDIFATHIYNQAVYQKFGTLLQNEYKHGICIL